MRLMFVAHASNSTGNRVERARRQGGINAAVQEIQNAMQRQERRRGNQSNANRGGRGNQG